MGKLTKRKGKVKRGGLSFRFFRSTPKRKIDPQQLKIEHALDTIEANQRYINDKHKKAIEEFVVLSQSDSPLPVANEHNEDEDLVSSIPEVEFMWPKKSYDVAPMTDEILQHEWFFPGHEAAIRELLIHKGHGYLRFESLTSWMSKNEKHLNLFPLQGYMWILNRNWYENTYVKVTELVKTVTVTLESDSYYPRFKELLHEFPEKTTNEEDRKHYLQMLKNRCTLAIKIILSKRINKKPSPTGYFNKLFSESSHILFQETVDEPVFSGLLFKFYIGVTFWLGDIKKSENYYEIDSLLQELVVY